MSRYTESQRYERDQEAYIRSEEQVDEMLRFAEVRPIDQYLQVIRDVLRWARDLGKSPPPYATTRAADEAAAAIEEALPFLRAQRDELVSRIAGLEQWVEDRKSRRTSSDVAASA